MTVYDPSPEEVEAWASKRQPTPWPEQDWDYYVSNGRSDSLILKYANDEKCPCRDFFVHCLYLIVGEYLKWYPSDQNRKSRINTLLSSVTEVNHVVVQHWATETRSVLAGDVPFVLSYWIDHLYDDQIDSGG